MPRRIRIWDILIALAVIGLIGALIVPAILAARESARREQCVRNLKQIGLGLHNYHDAFNCFPPGAEAALADDSASPGYSPKTKDTEGAWSWAVWMHPQMQSTDWFGELNPYDRTLKEALQHKQFRMLPHRSRNLYQCPSDHGDEVAARKLKIDPDDAPAEVFRSNYAGCVGASGEPGPITNRSGAFAWGSVRRVKDITDGTAYTIFVGERATETPRPDATLEGAAWPGAPPTDHGRAAVWAGCTNPDPFANDGYSAILGSTAYRMFDGRGGAAQPNFRAPQFAFSSNHKGDGANFLLMDGSTRFLSRTIYFSTGDQTSPPSGSPGIYNRLGMIADGFPLDAPPKDTTVQANGESW